MEFVCVKCKEHLPYERAFNAHTHIIGKEGENVYIESTDDEWRGECCQICTKQCAVKSPTLFDKGISNALAISCK